MERGDTSPLFLRATDWLEGTPLVNGREGEDQVA
jgi:hypothetical protein